MMSRLLTAVALGAVLLVGPVGAQTLVTPATPDPTQVGLIDRVSDLEDQLRKATAENERLQGDLMKSQAEVTRLTKALADASGQSADSSNDGSGGGDKVASAPPKDQGPPPDAATAFKSAYDLVKQGNHPAATKAFRSFLKTYPSSDFVPEAKFWLGQTLLAQGDGAGAAEQFLSVVKTSPKSAKAPESYLYLGIAFKKMGQKDQACAVLKDVPTKFPSAAPQVKSRAVLEAKSCAA